jgi:predicted house-cleaning noncanonical NTP pyrophosphatase (MazG superfamily)
MKKYMAGLLGLVILAFAAHLWEKQQNRLKYPSTSQDGIKRRKFTSNKLWRDTAPERLEQQDNAIVHVVQIDNAEYKRQLGLKLLEEAAEVQSALSEKEMISEIGDVYEVLDCIIALHNLSKDEIIAEQERKRAERGSYLARKYVTYAEYVPDGFMVPYCLAQPEKYQEIFD